MPAPSHLTRGSKERGLIATDIIELTANQGHTHWFGSTLLRVATRNSRALMSLSLACVDAGSTVLALLTAITLRVGLTYILPQSMVSRLQLADAFSAVFELAHPALLVPLFLMTYTWRGLYPAVAMSPIQEIRRLTIATSVLYLALATFTFILGTSLLYSRLVFALAWLFSLILVPAGRFAVRGLLARLPWWGEQVTVIRAGRTALDLVAHLNAHPAVGLRPALAVEIDPQAAITKESLEHMAEYCRDRLSCAVVVSGGSLGEIAEVIDRFRDIFKRVIFVDGRGGPRLNWDAAIDMAGIPGLEVHHNLLDRPAQVQKRIIDVVGSTLAMILGSPLLALIAVAVKLDSSGPVLFRQYRVGRDGHLFGMWKFRTMVMDAEQHLATVLESDADKRQEWDLYQKLREDPRVTRVGRLLRRFSLDELPQALNVISGEMSLVGPRPYFPEQEAAYGYGYSNYIRVRPGITGLWQISGRAKSPFADRIVLDEAYVRAWSIWMDLYILAMTPAAVFDRSGAF